MNAVAALSKILPRSTLCSGVDATVAGVVKPAALRNAECAMAEHIALEVSLTTRLRELGERLDYHSPLRTHSKIEQDALEAERGDLNRQLSELRNQVNEIRRQIAGLMPGYAHSVAAALAPFRRNAAEQLLEAISMAEQALSDIEASNTALISVGMAPPAAFALPYAAIAKGYGTKVLNERLP